MGEGITGALISYSVEGSRRLVLPLPLIPDFVRATFSHPNSGKPELGWEKGRTTKPA
jgi:hypothetical protein